MNDQHLGQKTEEGLVPFPGLLARARKRRNGGPAKMRLVALLILFDALLIAAVLLSFQRAELVEEEVTLLQTREVYDVNVLEQVVTHTTVITEIIPYGSEP